MNDLKLKKIYNEKDLSGGQTAELNAMQDEFNKIFAKLDSKKGDLEVWDFFEDTDLYFRDIFDNSEKKEILFAKIGEIKYIPSCKYIIKYLMVRYGVAIGDDNIAGLWDYLETEEWKINDNIDDWDVSKFKESLMTHYKFTNNDYVMTLSVLMYYLRIDYYDNGFAKKVKWPEYFKKLLVEFDKNLLKDMALGLQMEEGMYRLFRRKVLKYSEINFYDRDNILIYLIVKYAPICGEKKYFKAYDRLIALYPKKKTKDMKNRYGSTKAIGKWFLDNLEEKGMLKKIYRDTLFTEEDSKISEVLHTVDSLHHKDNKRTAEKVFQEQWNTLVKHIDKNEKKTIFEYIMSDKGNMDARLEYLGKQDIYRWLYGCNVNKTEKFTNKQGKESTRIVDRSDSDMVLLGNGSKDYFLNSRIFLETRLRDNTFSAFPKDEERQRNLLLTLGFLNFVFESYEEGGLSENYKERRIDFEMNISRILTQCGFQKMYSGSGYDAYLKLLLSCDEPIELFRYIWHMKTDSYKELGVIYAHE